MFLNQLALQNMPGHTTLHYKWWNSAANTKVCTAVLSEDGLKQTSLLVLLTAVMGPPVYPDVLIPLVHQDFFCTWQKFHGYKTAFAPKTRTRSHTRVHSPWYRLFSSSTGVSLNDFWQIRPVVQRHPKINCPFPSISSWRLLNSNHISLPFWAPLPKVGPVTHHKGRRGLDNVVSSMHTG